MHLKWALLKLVLMEVKFCIRYFCLLYNIVHSTTLYKKLQKRIRCGFLYMLSNPFDLTAFTSLTSIEMHSFDAA
jgi:hypothetical protein